jgi:hypothetical protein
MSGCGLQHPMGLWFPLRPCPPLSWREAYVLQAEIGNAIGRCELLRVTLQELATEPEPNRSIGIELCAEEMTLLRESFEEILAIVHGDRSPWRDQHQPPVSPAES